MMFIHPSTISSASLGYFHYFPLRLLFTSFLFRQSEQEGQRSLALFNLHFPQRTPQITRWLRARHGHITQRFFARCYRFYFYQCSSRNLTGAIFSSNDTYYIHTGSDSSSSYLAAANHHIYQACDRHNLMAKPSPASTYDSSRQARRAYPGI